METLTRDRTRATSEETTMADTMNEVMHPNLEVEKDPAFPNAPEGWTKARPSSRITC